MPHTPHQNSGWCILTDLDSNQTAMAATVKRSRPDICAWWFSWGGLLVSGTTVVALFAEYFWNPPRKVDKTEG